jgi:hypothetical protein
LHWTKGQQRVQTYVATTPRHHGHVFGFCNDCGSPMPSSAPGSPAAKLPAGAVDSPLPALPILHVYVGSKAPWYEITDSWPQLDVAPDEAAH